MWRDVKVGKWFLPKEDKSKNIFFDIFRRFQRNNDAPYTGSNAHGHIRCSYIHIVRNMDLMKPFIEKSAGKTQDNHGFGAQKTWFSSHLLGFLVGF